DASTSPESIEEPIIRPGPTGSGFVSVVADDTKLPIPSVIPAKARLGPRTLYGPTGGASMFTDNETNAQRVFGAAASRKKYVKDAFHRFVVNKDTEAVNPAKVGTKAALHYRFDVPAHGSIRLVLRLSDKPNLKNPIVEAEAE